MLNMMVTEFLDEKHFLFFFIAFLVTFYWIFFKIFDYILSLLPLFAIFWVLENATKISLMSFDYSPAVSEDWYKRGGYSSTYSHIKNYFGGRFWISESVHTGRSVYGSLKEGLVGRQQSWHEEERKKSESCSSQIMEKWKCDLEKWEISYHRSKYTKKKFSG